LLTSTWFEQQELLQLLPTEILTVPGQDVDSRGFSGSLEFFVYGWKMSDWDLEGITRVVRDKTVGSEAKERDGAVELS
jgi:hypothetical protein